MRHLDELGQRVAESVNGSCPGYELTFFCGVEADLQPWAGVLVSRDLQPLAQFDLEQIPAVMALPPSSAEQALRTQLESLLQDFLATRE